jgi:hypothetical protein
MEPGAWSFPSAEEGTGEHPHLCLSLHYIGRARWRLLLQQPGWAPGTKTKTVAPGQCLPRDLTAAAKNGINPKKASRSKSERRRGMSSGQAAFRERTVGAKFVCWQVAKKVPKPREEIVRPLRRARVDLCRRPPLTGRSAVSLLEKPAQRLKRDCTRQGRCREVAANEGGTARAAISVVLFVLSRMKSFFVAAVHDLRRYPLTTDPRRKRAAAAVAEKKQATQSESLVRAGQWGPSHKCRSVVL